MMMNIRTTEFISLLKLCSSTKHVSQWNSLVRRCVSGDSPIEAVAAFREMRRQGVKPNGLTLGFVFKACSAIAALREGRQARADSLKLGLGGDVFVGNTAVHFYGACGKVSDARKVFDEMPVRTVVSWNSVITACVGNSRFAAAAGYFAEMSRDGRFEPDETTAVLMLSAASGLGSLSLGKRVHSQVIVRGMAPNSKLGTALVDMYAKSGALGYAGSSFERAGERSVWTWTAMLLGLARHGLAEEALGLFSAMERSSVVPNRVTLLGVLSACGNAGLLGEARRRFREMRAVHGIEPDSAHYGAMADALARAGRLREARGFAEGAPAGPDAAAWRAVLGACGAAGRLVEAGPGRAGNLVMAANIYAAAGMWDEAGGVRRAMRRAGVRKRAGESRVEVGGGSARRFFCGYDGSCPGDESVYRMVDVLNLHMRMVNM